jgi:hypothetical protein
MTEHGSLGQEYWRLRGDGVEVSREQSYAILQEASRNYARWVARADGGNRIQCTDNRSGDAPRGVRCLLMDDRDRIGSSGPPGEPDQNDSDLQGETIYCERESGLARKSIP